MPDNFFDFYTKQDNNLLNLLSTDHLIRLKEYSDLSDIGMLYREIDSVYRDFRYNYSNWIALKYSLIFETKKLNGCLEDISMYKIYDWNERLKKIFRRDAKKYDEIFPQKLTPFITGSNKEKIKNIRKLIERLKPFPQANLIRKEIVKIYNQIKETAALIEMKSNELKAKFKLIEKSRADLSVYLFKNYNLLLERYPENPNKIHSFFDFSIIPEEMKISYSKLFQETANNKNYKIHIN